MPIKHCGKLRLTGICLIVLNKTFFIHAADPRDADYGREDYAFYDSSEYVGVSDLHTEHLSDLTVLDDVISEFTIYSYPPSFQDHFFFSAGFYMRPYAPSFLLPASCGNYINQDPAGFGRLCADQLRNTLRNFSLHPQDDSYKISYTRSFKRNETRPSQGSAIAEMVLDRANYFHQQSIRGALHAYGSISPIKLSWEVQEPGDLHELSLSQSSEESDGAAKLKWSDPEFVHLVISTIRIERVLQIYTDHLGAPWSLPRECGEGKLKECTELVIKYTTEAWSSLNSEKLNFHRKLAADLLDLSEPTSAEILVVRSLFFSPHSTDSFVHPTPRVLITKDRFVDEIAVNNSEDPLEPYTDDDLSTLKLVGSESAFVTSARFFEAKDHPLSTLKFTLDGHSITANEWLVLVIESPEMRFISPWKSRVYFAFLGRLANLMTRGCPCIDIGKGLGLNLSWEIVKKGFLPHSNRPIWAEAMYRASLKHACTRSLYTGKDDMMKFNSNNFAAMVMHGKEKGFNIVDPIAGLTIARVTPRPRTPVVLERDVLWLDRKESMIERVMYSYAAYQWESLPPIRIAGETLFGPGPRRDIIARITRELFDTNNGFVIDSPEGLTYNPLLKYYRYQPVVDLLTSLATMLIAKCFTSRITLGLNLLIDFVISLSNSEGMPSALSYNTGLVEEMNELFHGGRASLETRKRYYGQTFVQSISLTEGNGMQRTRPKALPLSGPYGLTRPSTVLSADTPDVIWSEFARRTRQLILDLYVPPAVYHPSFLNGRYSAFEVKKALQGADAVDMDKLRNAIVLDGGLGNISKERFLRVVEALSSDDKLGLYHFWTANAVPPHDKYPPLRLRPAIQARVLAIVAHTCSNQLEIPQTQNDEEMTEAVMQGILTFKHNDGGFTIV